LCTEGTLKPTNETYSLDEIFSMWARSGIQFSPVVREEYARAERVSLYECDYCQLGMFDPAIAGSPRFYEELQEQAGAWYYLADKWEFQHARGDLRGCRAVLEIGCGDGKFLRDLVDQVGVERAVGTEYNAASIEKARQRGVDVTASAPADLERTYSDGFDAVCAFQVLEHVDTPVEFLQSVRRLLRPGGIALFGVPNNGGLIRFAKPYLHDLPPHHLTRWCEATFRRGVERLGFQVQAVHFEPLAHYHYGWLFPLWLQYEVKLPGARLIRPLISRGARVFKWLGFKHLNFIRGHTVYVKLRAV
jgi:SAM-dependent methyltransferase